MVGIATDPVTEYLAIDPCSAPLGMAEFFKDHHPRPFAEGHTLAIFIEGFAVLRVDGLQGIEGRVGDAAEGFGAAADDGRCCPGLHQVAGIANGRGTGGTGGHKGGLRAQESQLTGDLISRGGAAEGGKGRIGRPLAPALKIIAVDRLAFEHAAGPAADDHAELRPQLVGNREQPGIRQGLDGGDHGHCIGPGEALQANEPWQHVARLEVPDLTAGLRAKIAGIEDADRTNTAMAGTQGAVKGGSAAGRRINGAQSGDDNPL